MSVFSNLKPKNDAVRNGFDLSRRVVFSNKSGQITSMFVQPTLPDSEYRIDVSQLMRTQPLQTAAFTGAGINYDFVFVPLNHLYSSFNQFIAQRECKNLANQPSNTVIPTFNLQDFVYKISVLALYDYINSTLWPSQSAYMRDMLQSQSQPAVSAVPPYLISSNNVDSSQSVYLGVIRTLDMLGYGNYLPFIDILYECYKKRKYPGVSQSTFKTSYMNALISDYASAQTDLYLKMQTILSDFTTTLSDVFDEITPTKTLRPNLWPVLAYNKCFFEYYRNTYYDLDYAIDAYYASTMPATKFDYVQLFNFDDWSSNYNQTVLGNGEMARLIAMFTPKYHTYKRDLFTGVLPSTQFGSVEVMTDDRSWLNIMVKGAGSVVDTNIRVAGGSQNVSASGSATSVQRDFFRFDPALAISVLESRRADAMQRFKERMMRAGDKTKDVFEAHGWSKPYSEQSFEPVFLGSYDGRLELNPVASTTDTQSTNGTELAQLGSHGTAVVSGSQIKFQCHDFGIILGLNYILKDAEYDAYGLDRHLQLTEPFDYPYPELQNISLAPIVRGELCALSTTSVNPTDKDNFNYVLGYLPRYMEFKTAVDKVHGEFYSAQPLVQSLDSYLTWSQWPLTVRRGVFADWSSPRRLNDFLFKSFMYQDTTVFDNVFYQAANSLQSTDQFLFNCFVRCTAVEPLTVIGLPI